MSPLPTTVSQASFAAAVLVATAGSYMALSPPNPNAAITPKTGDAMRWLHLTHQHVSKVAIAPLGLLALHTSSLALLYPTVPSSVLGHGAANKLNVELVTWSSSTSIPLVLLLCAGIPLRLIAYSSLGRNFTFALAEPDRLTTTGIYRYVQHPSYTGLAILVLGNLALLFRMDGALSCWVSPQFYPALRDLEWMSAPVGVSLLLSLLWTRVKQEERMLHAKFGLQWERWHAATARFIPWLL
ncbi:hypothetical protein GQ53DRAFT_681176 [Thozetella sp. PMI_491]|nr:hypothetical protein GQ53DRAFT_681176 [Thozetella sp. PMI_491]